MDWDELLEELPQTTQVELTRALRRSLIRRLKRMHTGDDPTLVPDSVRSQAICTWRRRYLKGASKSAKRRKNYARLKSDPSYQEIERELMRGHLARNAQRLPDAQDVKDLSFSELCEAYALTHPVYGSSGLENLVIKRIRKWYANAIRRDALHQSFCKRVQDVAMHQDLNEFTNTDPEAVGAFSLQGMTNEQQVARRLRETRMVDRMFKVLYKPNYNESTPQDVVTGIIVREFEQEPHVRALNNLLEPLFGTPRPFAKAMRNESRKDARKIVDDLKSERLCNLVAHAILQNPRYARQFEQSVELLLRVRNNVPRTPMDAYPLARTMHRRFVIHVGPTNSGKTHDALKALSVAESGVYLGPLRLLAFEQFERLNLQGCPCSLLTGEELIEVPCAHHTSSTVEMASYDVPIEVAVIDEAQMIRDPDRGYNWTNALLGVPAREVHVCCAPHAEHVVRQLVELCEDTYEVVHHERLVPLLRDRARFVLPGDVRPGDALVVFSRKSVHAVASLVASRGLRPSLVYGALPYEVRHEEARKFDTGLTDVVVATDAIGMGMNLPIRRVVFVEQYKFDGRERRMLRPDEIQQIAGRAGRYGRYDEGLYTSTRQRGEIAHRYTSEIEPITSIPVGIPENIALVRDATLTDSIHTWMRLEQPEPFVRMDAERDLRLIGEIESKLPPEDARDIATKRMVLLLATMPFDERDQRLLGVWRSMVDAQLAMQHIELMLPEVDLDLEQVSLAELEADYRYCDLLYNYERTFGDHERMAELVNCRNRIARAIMDLFDKDA